MFTPKILNSSNSKTAASLERLAARKNLEDVFEIADYSDDTDAYADLDSGFNLALLGIERQGHAYLLELGDGGVVMVGKAPAIRAALKALPDNEEYDE